MVGFRVNADATVAVGYITSAGVFYVLMHTMLFLLLCLSPH